MLHIYIATHFVKYICIPANYFVPLQSELLTKKIDYETNTWSTYDNLRSCGMSA